MIYTLTLNPSIDYIMYVDNIRMGETNRAQGEKMLPGGKGINVSRILNQFGVSNQAMGFAGGTTGLFIQEWLAREGSDHHFITVDDNTRINVKLKGEVETEINGVGPAINAAQSQALLNQISQLGAADTLILSGSKAKGLADDFYQQIVAICRERQIAFVIDTNSKELLEALPAKPFLVKPNQAELGDFFNTIIETEAEVVKYGRQLQQRGAQNVIVSLGGAGAVFIDASQVIFAEAPSGQVINTVGSGDSMIAGFVAGAASNLTKSAAFELAVQCGSATAFNEDLATYADIMALNGHVKMRKVEES